MTDTETSGITAIVVTYNRIALLRKCISSLLQQTLPLRRIIIIDNASHDGTKEAFSNIVDQRILYIRLPENTGGAGGFSAGIQHAVKLSDSWFWLMDDDACPYPNAAEELAAVAKNTNNIYGSLAVFEQYTSWTTTLIDQARVVNLVREVPKEAHVESLPFLGFLIHRNLVDKVGLPDVGYFIAADDVEYCTRTRRAGAQIILAGNSRIEHPRTQQQIINVLGVNITYLSLPPWKRYYDTRNRLLIARKYYGMQLFTKAIPGTFVRLGAALLKEPGKLAQLHAFSAGIFDGLAGLKGKRHIYWGISP